MHPFIPIFIKSYIHLYIHIAYFHTNIHIYIHNEIKHTSPICTCIPWLDKGLFTVAVVRGRSETECSAQRGICVCRATKAQSTPRRGKEEEG